MKTTFTTRRILRKALEGSPESFTRFLAETRLKAEYLLQNNGFTSPPSVSSRLYAMERVLVRELADSTVPRNESVRIRHELDRVREYSAILETVRLFERWKG